MEWIGLGGLLLGLGSTAIALRERRDARERDVRILELETARGEREVAATLPHLWVSALWLPEPGVEPLGIDHENPRSPVLVPHAVTLEVGNTGKVAALSVRVEAICDQARVISRESVRLLPSESGTITVAPLSTAFFMQTEDGGVAWQPDVRLRVWDSESGAEAFWPARVAGAIGE